MPGKETLTGDFSAYARYVGLYSFQAQTVSRVLLIGKYDQSARV